MRICMVVGTLLEFGGLEEFAQNLAIGVQKQGHQVSFVSTTWVPPDNQYLANLIRNNITFVQPPGWLSLPASDWATKEKILRVSLRLLSPLIVLLGFALFLVKGTSFSHSLTSSRNWLQGQLMKRVIGPDRRRFLVRMLLNWWRLRWHPDVIHIQGYTSTLLFVIDWAHQKGLPVIYEEHQTPDPQFDWWQAFSKTINKATMVVAVSGKSAEAMHNVCGVTRPIAKVYYMVSDPYESGWKPESRDDGPRIRITTPARLYVTKGLNYLLEAAVKVKAVYPDVEFRIYGDGEMRDELLAYAEKLGLDGYNIFAGVFTSRDELSAIMAETDIFLMSSILEGLPVALLEAMSYGLPIVATTVGGIPEAITDGVNGLLCPPRDPDALARKICSLIEDPEMRRRLGAAARKSYEDGPYKPAAVCAQYIALYRSAVTRATDNIVAAMMYSPN